MKLYLLQHGDAVPENVDPKRPLSEKGRRDIEGLKPLPPLKAVPPPPSGGGKERRVTIYHSGKLRAQQTAEIIAQGRPVAQKNGLAPNDPVEPLYTELQSRDDDIMLVGHQPFLGKLAAKLLTGDENKNIINFVPGTLLCLERAENKVWLLCAMIPPTTK